MQIQLDGEHAKTWTPNALIGALAELFLLATLCGIGNASAQIARPESNTGPPSPSLDFEPNLPVVALEAKGQIDHVQKTPCLVRIIDLPGARRLSSNGWPAVVKIHGGVSQSYPKP